MSTYFTNIPEADDNPTDSQDLMKSNFNAIFDAQNRNHVNFSDIPDSGRHEVIEIQQQTANPTPISGFGDLFVRKTGSPEKQNLFFLDSDSNLSQLTNAFDDDTTGFIIFPGGLQFKWGKSTALQESTQFIPYNTTAFDSKTINVQTTVNKIDTVGKVVMLNHNIPPTVTGFNVVNNNNGNDIEFFWLAIGI